MTVNISYIRLKDKVIENYSKSLKGWTNRDIEWNRLKNVLSNSKIQFTPVAYKNGVKKSKNLDRTKQNMIVIDVDDNLSLVECQRMFSKYKYLIGTTKSHDKLKQGKVCNRYRLLLPSINIPLDDDVYFRALRLMFEFGDIQTETKTSAYLGNDDALIIYNDGKLLDLHKASILATEQLREERVEKKVIDRDYINSYGNSSLEDVKSMLSKEIVIDILESMGYEVDGNKFSVRDENTKSVKVYDDGGMFDFGSSKHYDIFAVLTEYQDMSFKQALNYVRNFI